MVKIFFIFNILLSLSIFSNNIGKNVVKTKSKKRVQSDISGKIIDNYNDPLPGVSIYLPELNKEVISDDKGEYFIDNIPKGYIKIEFYAVGYNKKIETIKVSKTKNILNVTLTMDKAQSIEVVVTASRITSQHKNAVKVDILKSKDIELSGSSSFMESLTKVPGVDMIAKGQGVAKPVIRGLSMNDILVLNNGVRIENYQFSENHPLGIDGNDLKRVEIVKGPASLLYGSDAIGGVINFIKEKTAPIGKIVGDYRLQLHSNTLGMNNNIGLKGASKSFFGGFRFGHKTHADYLQGGGDYVPNTRFNEITFNANSGYTGKIGTFKIYYDYFKQELGMSVPPVKDLITEQGRENDVWYQDLEYHIVSSRNSLYLGDFKWDINGAYQKALRKLQTTLDVPFVEMNLDTITYESKLHLPSSKGSEYIIGIQGMYQKNRNKNDRASQFLPDSDINNIGFLGVVKYTFFKKLKLQGGLRYDIYKTETFALGTEGTESYHPPVKKDFSSLNGSIGATFNPNRNFTFRFNLAKGYRVPNLSELTSNGMHGNRYEMGNSDLSPENSFEGDLSINFRSNFLTLSVAGFYNKINDYIFIAPTSELTGNGTEIYRFSQTDATLFGGEAGFHLHPKSLKWFHIEATYSKVIGKQKNDDYLPFIPADKLRYEIRTEGKKIGFLHKPTIKISGLTVFSQDNSSPYETSTEGYTLINFGVNSEFIILDQNIVLGVIINNIFDTQYYDHLSTLKGLKYYNQGRDISLYLKIPFEIL